MEFMGKLLTLRVLFDRYVVKVRAESEEDENLQWVLHRPYIRDGKLKFKNTFSDNVDADDNETEGNMQKRIVKQLSMPQVSFRNRKYKNWLFNYLDWLNSNYCDQIESVSPESIVAFLDNWLESYFTANIENSYKGKNNENVFINSELIHHIFYLIS